MPGWHPTSKCPSGFAGICPRCGFATTTARGSARAAVLLLKPLEEEDPGSSAARPDPAPVPVGSEWCRGSVGGAGPCLALSLWLQLRVQRVDDFPGSGAAGCGGVFAAALIPQPKTAERADKGCGGEEPPQGGCGIPTSLCVWWWQQGTAQLWAWGAWGTQDKADPPKTTTPVLAASLPALHQPADSVPNTSKLNRCQVPAKPQTSLLAEPPIPTSTGANLQAPNFGFWRLSIHTVCAMTWEPGALLFIAAAQRNGGKPALSHSSKCWSHSGVCPVLPGPPPHLPFVTGTQRQVAFGQAMPDW